MQAAWPSDFSLADRVALAWFLVAWLGYGVLIWVLQRPRSVASRMCGMRRAWMHTMLGRDNRIADASLLGSSMSSATFFASTAMLALAALVSGLGSFGQVYDAIQGLSVTAKTSRAAAEAKLLLLVLIFSVSFLKLTWALRQLNFCLAVVGAAPLKPDPEQRDSIADRAALVLTLAVSSFNAGIRGYYFALAALAWFIGPSAMAVATSVIVAMLLWRQCGSATARAIRDLHSAYGEDWAGVGLLRRPDRRGQDKLHIEGGISAAGL